ncbi:MAG: hypothetical protein JNL01_06765 [Bdellovibrionales bacterium]|nr:hypothetical protein [Bdellovibrionales bacterium]
MKNSIPVFTVIASLLSISLFARVLSAEERADAAHCDTIPMVDSALKGKAKRQAKKAASENFHSFSLTINQKVGDYIKPKNGLDSSGMPFQIVLTGGRWVSMYSYPFTAVNAGAGKGRSPSTIHFKNKEGKMAKLTYPAGPFGGLSMASSFKASFSIANENYALQCRTVN